MDLKKAFATNKKKELDGVWVKAEDGAQFLIARYNNTKAEKLTGELMRPHRRRARLGTLPDEIQRDVSFSVLANAVLLDWKGVQVDGKDVSFSPELAKKMFDEIPDFADFIAGFSMDVTLFQDRAEAERQGN